jgi:6-phosphogluconolactonase
MTNRRVFLLGLTAAAIFLPNVAIPNVAIAKNYNPSRIGTIYTTSNATSGNELLAFDEMSDGTLEPAGSISTGGKGSGGGLGNQGAIVLTRDRRFLLTVNAGSNDLSVFKFDDRKPKLVSKVSSGGNRPVSVTVQNNLVYVVNAGSDDVTGFYLKDNGQLSPLPNSRKALSSTTTAPAQVQFTPDGRYLVVTEKATNVISTFPLKYDGYLGNRITNPSAGKTPFGFAFDRKSHLLVSEAAGGAPNASSLSSYRIPGNGRFQVITAAAKTNQSAACWVVVSKNGEYAYVSNTGSDSLTGFKILENGGLKPLNADGKTAVTGAGPIDMIFSRNGRFLSSLNAKSGTISTFRMLDGGGLTATSTLEKLPTTATGLVAR